MLCFFQFYLLNFKHEGKHHTCLFTLFSSKVNTIFPYLHLRVLILEGKKIYILKKKREGHCRRDWKEKHTINTNIIL